MARRGKAGRRPLQIAGAAILAGVVFRTFGYEAFNIPSGSMHPTLINGDTVLVSKFAYGFSRFSLPIWHPDVAGRLFARLPARGDVVVFKLPRDPHQDYIKRVVGLPGDTLRLRQGRLYLNDVPVPVERVGDFIDVDDVGRARIPQFTESLPGGRSYAVVTAAGASPLDDTQSWTVPPDHVFVLGDNRHSSEDSRAMDLVGFVPVDNLVGRASLVLFSLEDRAAWWELWRWPIDYRQGRTMLMLQ